MLATYKATYFHPRTQFITIDEHGNVLESDDLLFPLAIGDTILNVSPFFEGFIPFFASAEDYEVDFSCIHLENHTKNDFICDIEFKTFANPQQPSLIIIHDFTDHYKYYQNVAQSRNESVINSQILELKNKYLQEKEDFKNSFIANFSHELRNPLSGISAFSTILQKTQLTNEQHDYLEVIKSSAGHLENMIGDILEISKIEVGKLTLHTELFDFHTLVNMLEFSYSVKAKQKGLEFIVEMDERIPTFIQGDKTRIKQILENLIENALKFTHEGSITLAINENHRRAQKVNLNITVTDTGIGIPNDKAEAIFQRFTQLNDRNDYAGTGLGLSIVKGLVELMGGKITVTGEENKGTTFKINLSLRYPIDQQKVPLREKKRMEEANALTKEKYSVLLVEDSELSQMAVLKILAQEGKFFLDMVSNGDEAIQQIIDNEYDLILIDIRIPGTPGDELTKMIRKLPIDYCKKVPIIALTANLFSDDKKRYKKASMNDIIEKPFDEATLLEKIYKHLK